jgi:hypothetical protein
VGLHWKVLGRVNSRDSVILDGSHCSHISAVAFLASLIGAANGSGSCPDGIANTAIAS